MDKESSGRMIEALVKKYDSSFHSEHSEQDTATKFIRPFLESLGWNIADINEFREEFQTSKGILDGVVLLKGKPHIAIEYKGLRHGAASLKVPEERLKTQSKLLEMARDLHCRYALLTRFAQSALYDVESGKELDYFKRPREYQTRFEDIWRYLSKP